MGATAVLTSKAAAVQPGGETSCEIRVRNSGQVVDQFTLEVLGDAAGWAVVEPSTLSLFPGAEAVARIRFKPPKTSSVAARAIPFAVRVRSREDSRASMVEEGMIEVGSFVDTTAELVPRSARGSVSARAQLALDNRGNSRVNARLTASDPDRKLDFTISPPGLVAEPGTATFARIRLRPRERFFTGPPKTLPYKVFVHQDGQPPLAVDGVMVQQGLLPTWLVPALIGLAVLSLVLVVLWLTVLQPSIKSAATAAVAPQASAASAAASKAASAAAAIAPAGGTKAGAGGSNPLGGASKDDRITPNSVASPYDPQGALSLTDLIFENPDGNSGTLTLKRVDLGTKTSLGTLLVLRMENFRDLDFHFVSPIVLPKGQGIALECTNQPQGQTCTASLYYSGYLKQ
jgi:hypothetical protein